MKRWMFIGVAIAIMLSMFGATAFATGNGAPSGPHYNLNIIGVSKAKTADMTGNNGGRIFVPEYGSAKIMLSPSADGGFKVLDANGTDGTARFELPLPGLCYGEWLDGDFVTPASCTVRYTVWIRALGKPDRSARMGTCIEDTGLAGGYICSDPDMWVDVTRSRGKSTFTNVSSKLLFVSADVDNDGRTEHVQIFDPAFDQYYWQYDNSGLKLAQMRFYMGDYTIKW